MRRDGRRDRVRRVGVAVLLVAGPALVVVGCGSSSDPSAGAGASSEAASSSTSAGVSGRRFCAAAQTVEAANDGQLDHILTRAEAEARLASQLKLLAAAASPSQGEGWADEAPPLRKAAAAKLDAALAACDLTDDIFGVSAAKSDGPPTTG